jgi:hypothetical protein
MSASIKMEIPEGVPLPTPDSEAQMISFGYTMKFGSTTYNVRGFETAEQAMWAAFRGIALSCKFANLLPRDGKKYLRQWLSKREIASLDRIALAKLSK